VLVRAVAKRGPSQKALLLYASPGQMDHCADTLTHILAQGGARGALLTPPADGFCMPGGSEDERPSGATVPLVRFPSYLLRFDSFGRVIGFEAPRAEDSELAAMGVHAARFIATGPIESVPAVSLAELARGDLPSSVLRDRAVIVVLSDDESSLNGAPADARATPAKGAAAAYGALLEGGERERAPAWLGALLSMAVAAGVAVARTRYRGTGAAFAFALGFGLIALLQLGYAAIFIHSLLALSSMLVGVGMSSAAMSAYGLVTSKLAIERATEIVERTALFRTQGIDAVHDAEFWPRVGALAAQAHPADFVLIAELPAHSWHLRFWPTARADERLVSERRRDIRRTPYSDEKGVPRIRAVNKFLVMPDVPTVVVPLVAMGEIEGYVFLCGTKAEAAFREDPGQAERMAQNLALLLRRRRMGMVQQEDWRRSAGIVLDRPALALGKLVDGAQLAMDEVRLFASLWREAPVPLLYADSFLDVRMMGGSFGEILAEFGLPPVQSAKEAPLPPGTLPLSRVLTALTGKSEAQISSQIAALTENAEASLDIVTTPAETGRREYELSVRAVRQHAEGTSWTAAYVASLVERRGSAATPANVHVLPGAGGDPLVAFPLAELLAPVVAAASRRSARPLHLEPPKGHPQIVGHRGELARMFEHFLTDAAKRSPVGKGPVLAVRERSAWVELTILDLDFGLPNSVLEKVLIAPSAAPLGLESFAALVNAVDGSFGRVKLRAPDGWGTGLILEFIRVQTKTVLAAANDTAVVDLPKWSRDR
jgi:signal transduction histidine kinase